MTAATLQGFGVPGVVGFDSRRQSTSSPPGFIDSSAVVDRETCNVRDMGSASAREMVMPRSRSLVRTVAGSKAGWAVEVRLMDATPPRGE